MRALGAAELLLSLLLAGSVFALGAVRPAASLSIWAGSVLLLALALLAAREDRTLAAQLGRSPLLRPGLCLAGWIVLQLIAPSGWPLRTLSTSDTARGLAFLLAGLALHVGAAAVLARERARRRLVRTLTWMGLLLAFAALIQSASGTWLIYGVFTPDAHSLPFGPFWNRNHYASYMLMIVPVTLAHLSLAYARYVEARGSRTALRHRLVALLDPRGSALLAALLPPLATIVSLIATTSRAGMLSLVGGLLVARPTEKARRRAWALAIVAVLLGALAVGLGPIALRFAQASEELQPGNRGRLAIWRASLQAMDGAWLTGSGFNTFPLRVSGWVMYPAAHNQYLQLLVETGLPGLALGLWAAFAALASVWHDPWPRAAIAGVLLHSFLEFSLQIPAVACLFVVLAAWPTERGAEQARARLVRRARAADD